ncbi:hypothetical protein J6590_012873 [Homalodisca vitripennis]|nr:hypothetical protein J6590_012873 [Homalodisca vitripennis]
MEELAKTDPDSPSENWDETSVDVNHEDTMSKKKSPPSELPVETTDVKMVCIYTYNTNQFCIEIFGFMM